MKCMLRKNELKDALAGVGKVVTGKSSLPVLGCVRITAGSGGVIVQTTDLDQVLEYSFGHSQVDVEGACILPLSTLKELAKGGKDEQVEIEAGDRITLINHVGGHALQQSVAGMDINEWPCLATDIQTASAEQFLTTYRRLAPFASTDSTRMVINSVNVEVGKGDKPVTMAATDGRRLACFNSIALPLKKSIVVPVTKFLRWKNLSGDCEIGIREDDGQVWLGVSVGAFTYTVRCVDSRFPDYRQVIPEAGEHVITFADSDVDLLKKVLPTFPGDDALTIVGNDGKVTLYGRGRDDTQWTTLTLDATDYVGERSFIGLNKLYLLEALAAGFRVFSITDELSPLLSRDGNGGVHVLMPLRGQDPESTADDEETAKPAATAEPATAVGSKEPEPSRVSAAPEARTETRRKTVTKQKETKSEDGALDRVLAACDSARARVKDAGQSLTELAAAIKDASREQKSQSKEVEQARVALSKLQSISL